jgi:hypothetical protein
MPTFFSIPPAQNNLNSKQVSPEQLVEYLEAVWDGKQELTTINYDYTDGKTKDIASGFEVKINQ